MRRPGTALDPACPAPLEKSFAEGRKSNLHASKIKLG
jgi:hypothetical protein